MRNKRGTRGAISVFLAMILVPCILASSLFVDLGRVHLSRSVAEASADLALNSLLTNYDADLKEWYGMMASCQEYTKYIDTSKQYFTRNLASKDMAAAEIILISDHYKNVTEDTKIHDLLKVALAEGSQVTIDPVKDADLTNPTLIKDQIVEFMKYRAPIEIVSGLVQRIKSDPSVSGVMEADENKPLVDSKDAYYKAEGELVGAAYYSYLAMRKYFNESSDKLKNEDVAAIYAEFSRYKTAYQDILRVVVSNLSNTSGLTVFSRYTLPLDKYHAQYTDPDRDFSSVYSQKKKENDEYVYYIDLEDVKTLVDELSTAIGNFETAKDNFGREGKSLCDKLPYGTADGQPNNMQWWVQMDKAVSAYKQPIIDNAKKMLQAYSKVLAIYECTLRGDVPKGWTSLADWEEEYGVADLLAKAEDLQKKYLTAGAASGNDPYLKAANNLASVAASMNGKRNANNNRITLDGKQVTLQSALTTISNELKEDRAYLQKYVDLLNIAIDGDGDKTPSIDSLITYADNYENSLENWVENAENSTTDLGKKDRKEIEEMPDDNLEISASQVRDMKTRLVNMRSQLQDAINAIDNLKFGTKSLKDITNVDTFKSCAQVDTTKIKLYNSEIKSYADSLLNSRFSPGTLPQMQHMDDPTYNLTLNPYSGDVEVPELFLYLHKKYLNVDEQKMDQTTDEQDEAEKQKESAEKDAKNKSRYHYQGEEIPQKYSSGEAVGLGDAFNGLIGIIEKLFTLDFTGMRDDLYATTYIMKMFSYATYEDEGKYHLLEKADPDVITKLTLTEGSENYYVNKYADVAGEAETDKGTWASTDPMNPYNKTLTNKMINATNNRAYCAEVEYILCGNADMEEGESNTDKGNVKNVKSVYGKIYGIRYALNLVSGFQHFFTLSELSAKKNATAQALYAAANLVALATSGIVPVAVTEAIVIPIITVFETAKDLDRLEAGFPVELYKSDDSHWWVSLSVPDKNNQKRGGVGQLLDALTSGNFERTNSGQGVYYSDYLTLFVYLGLNSDAQEDMYKRVAEVMEFNLQKATAKDDYSLQNSKMYFELKAKLRVSPLMLALPYFSVEEYDADFDTKTDWCTYSINTVRGYS